MSLAIKIKHSGKVYDITVDPSLNGLSLKEQVATLTNVPTDRQKILVRGGPLKDDVKLNDVGLKAGQTVMVLGTPLEKVITETDAEKVQFVEDRQGAGAIVNGNLLGIPSGLVNLGNTCYLNSSIQLLHTIDDLKEKLNSDNAGSSNALVKNTKELFAKIESADGEKVTPLNFLSSVRNAFPQFQERSRDGFYKQQDAEEAYSQILNVLVTSFPDLKSYLNVELKKEMRCMEGTDGDEDVSYDYEDALKLNCHINSNVNFLIDGLKNGLTETIEKHNDSLGRNAKYEIKRKIIKLPKYLTINFVRFYWKRETGKKAKIMRKVQFPFQLDVMELVDDAERERLIKSRDEISKLEKEMEESYRSLKKQKLSGESGSGSGSVSGAGSLTTREQYEQQKTDMKKMKEERANKFGELFQRLGASAGENASSLYDLVGIIAHQGASAESGHYQAFIKDEADLTGSRWYRFNDDVVTIIDREKILALAGGSEGDSALVLLYKGVGM
jgi:ubiquitin carboxyl-terminal hydrolase 14